MSLLSKTKITQPSRFFYAGLAVVMLIFWMWFIPDWSTFIHTWKVEFFASVLLAITLLLAYRHHSKIDLSAIFSQDETRLILLPLFAFIVWSAASVLWAPSWKSAVHHTLVWTLYLIFFGLVRYSLNLAGQYKRFLFVFAGSLIVCAIPAIAGYVAILIFGGSNTLGIRFSRFGEQVALLLPLVLVALVKLRGRQLLLGSIAVAILWLLVFCSMSRAGMLMFTSATLITGAILLLKSTVPAYRLKFSVILLGLIVSPVLLQGFGFLSEQGESPSVARLADRGALSNSNDFRKLMATISFEMFFENPVTGVGGDNFGFEAHRYRETYAAADPSDPHLAQAESTIPERAHNEYLQILAELGVVGAGIFGWFLFGIGVMTIRALKGFRTLPMHAPAAMVGLLMFLAGALVTSYSFRLIQNGFVFFFVLAVAAKLLLRTKGFTASPEQRSPIAGVSSKFVLIPAISACVLLFAHCSLRVSSVILTERASATQDLGQAEHLFQLAQALDNENPSARNYHGMRLFREQRFEQAVPHLTAAIDIGLATSDAFSYLATAQSLSGDSANAEKTMGRAATLYPNSAFVLVRYALLQSENGNPSASAATLARANLIDSQASRTWQTMITKGFRIASSKEAQDRDNLIAVMDLQPQTGIHAVLSERLIKHPEEQRDSLFRAVNAQPVAAPPDLVLPTQPTDQP